MKYLAAIFLAIITSFLGAQTTLPTSWDFVSTPATLPTGWSTNTTGSYSSGLSDLNGTSSKAGKLQATGHFFTINFFDTPGTLTYHIRSYGTASFQGTFIVEESDNGSTWSTLTTFGNNSFNDQWTSYTLNPSATSHYVRFHLTNKISGTNVGLDNVSLSALTTTEPEINLLYSGNDVPNGTGVQFAGPVGTAVDIDFLVENLGTGNDLTLTSPSLSGSAASDYSVSSFPSSVSSLSLDTLRISFNAGASGNRNATLSIPNNDQDEDPYIIQLNGIGGTEASEPGSNPSSFSNPVLKTYRFKVDFADVSSDGYIALMRKHEDFTEVPMDNVAYELGEGIGNAKVAYIGSNSEFYIHEGLATTDYFMKVFAFNGSGQFVNYKTDNPLEIEITTPEESMIDANYYQGVDELTSSFIDDLHDVINPHMVRFYSNYDDDFVPGFYERDTLGGQGVITAVYSGENVVFTPPFGWPSTDMNREHTMPASWMPTAGNNGTPEYQDYHHLHPTKGTANSQRSNHPFGNVVNVNNSYGFGRVGTNSSGNTVYEPRSSHKGDAARSVLYMQVAYHNVNGNSWALDDLNSNGSNQSQAVLKEWHINDLPSGFDKARNDFLDSLQQNRNPFTDSAHWVCYIDFKTMSYIANPDTACINATTVQIMPPSDTTDTTINDTTNSVGMVNPENWIFYPNPAQDFINIGYLGQALQSVEIYDLTGALISKAVRPVAHRYDISNLSSGLYFVRLKTSSQHEELFRLMKE